MTPTRITNAIAAAFGIVSSLSMHSVFAQQSSAPAPESTQRIERVEVTGSSIKRIDAETALPVQVLNREDIQRTGASTVEQLLQTVTAAASSGAIAANAASGATTGSISSVSLRGLTSIRTLVLINGRRISPYGLGFTNDSVSVDVNSIPVSAIERVEVLKDGASAVYGSDAIAGVVNFVLRKDFQGAEATVEYGDSTQGGADLTRVTGTYGVGDLGKDRYNFMITGTYQKEGALFGRDRPFASSSINLNTLNDGASRNAFPANVFTLDNLGLFINPNYPNCSPSVVSSVFELASPGVCSFDPSKLVTLTPQTKRSSVFATGRIAISDSFEAFGEFSFTRNEQRTVIQPVPISGVFALPPNHPLFNVAPYNGFSTIILQPSSAYYPSAFIQSQIGAGNPLPDLFVLYRSVVTGNRDITDISEAPRLTLGFKGLAAGWDYDTTFLYSASKVTQRVNAGYPSLERILPLLNSGRVNFFGPNTPAVDAELRATQFFGNAFVNSTKLTGVSAKASRELIQMASGPMALALGAEFRNEQYKVDPNPVIQSGDISGYGGNFLPVDRKRNVSGAFGELNIPIAAGLEANAAVRHDRYQGSGNATAPKISLRWQPAKSVLLRTSYGQGFRAPSLADLYSPNLSGVSANGLSDPVRCPTTGLAIDCATQFAVTTGGNPQLDPEKSNNFTVGLVLEPNANLSIGLDAFRIELKDTIVNGVTPTVILGDLAQYGNLVTRGPVDPNLPNLPGPITNINQTNINFGRTIVSGVDVDAKLRFGFADTGRMVLSLSGTYFTKYDGENPDGSFTSAIDVPNTATSGLIPRWRHYLSFNWSRGPWAATLAQSWQKSYYDVCGNSDADCQAGITAPRRVGSYETYDFQGTYSGFKNLQLTLGIKNLFDRDPPFTNTGGTVSFQAGYDPQYADPRGRFVYARATYSFK
jgi:iron complex outermembrane recepter protein